MLTAHLPAGYCAARLSRAQGTTFGAILLGAILPDFDMIAFHFIDHGAFHHHRYWVHIPAFWALIALVVIPVIWRTRWRGPVLGFLAAIFLHLVLDSLSGGILWGAPLSQALYSLVTVPATQSHWVLSFVLHWTFVFEITIWLLAAWLFLNRPKR